MRHYKDIEVGEQIFIKSKNNSNSVKSPIDLLSAMVLEKNIIEFDDDKKNYTIKVFLLDYRYDSYTVNSYDRHSKNPNIITISTGLLHANQKPVFKNIVNLKDKNVLETYKEEVDLYINSLNINDRFQKEIDSEIYKIQKNKLI